MDRKSYDSVKQKRKNFGHSVKGFRISVRRPREFHMKQNYFRRYCVIFRYLEKYSKLMLGTVFMF